VVSDGARWFTTGIRILIIKNGNEHYENGFVFLIFASTYNKGTYIIRYKVE